MRAGLYPFGPCTCTSPDEPAKYSDVLLTPNVTIARAGEPEGYALLPTGQQISVSLVAAAAPNLRLADPKEIFDREHMYNTVKMIFLVPRLLQPELTTLVLGAWGCGAFGGDPVEVSELFCRAIVDEGLGQLYEEVHFAIPSGTDDQNANIFREALRRHGLAVRESQPGRRGPARHLPCL